MAEVLEHSDHKGDVGPSLESQVWQCRQEQITQGLVGNYIYTYVYMKICIYVHVYNCIYILTNTYIYTVDF